MSLDLCLLHQEHGEWPELKVLAADTYQRFQMLSGNTQAVAALSLCVHAARARLALSAAASEELIAQAQRKAAAALDAAREIVAVKMAQS